MPIDMKGLECDGICPESMEPALKPSRNPTAIGAETVSSLSQWPVQLHLVNPQAARFKNADVVLAADCTAFAFGDFHRRFVKDHSLAIACPKLDTGKEEYIEKISVMIDVATINTLTVVIMEVPCCGGLVRLTQQAAAKATRSIPIKKTILGIQGGIVKEEWV